MCENMRNTTVTKRLNVLTVGLTQDSLLLITRDFYVYEVPRDDLSRSIDKLYLNAKAMPIQDKWPALWNAEKFKQIRDNIYNSFFVLDNESTYLCLTTNNQQTDNLGVNFQLRESKIFEGWTYYPGDTTESSSVLISNDKIGIFYSMRRLDQTLQMTRYKFSASTVRESDNIYLMEDYSNICVNGKRQLVVTKQKCKENFQRDLMLGFVNNRNFILFGKDRVYVFGEKIYESKDVPMSYHEVAYNEFFFCNATIDLNKDTDSRKWLTFGFQLW